MKPEHSSGVYFKKYNVLYIIIVLSDGKKLLKYRKGVIMEEMGMTNEQYKGMLLDELENWREVLELAKKENSEEVKKKAEKQIEKINEKLKF